MSSSSLEDKVRFEKFWTEADTLIALLPGGELIKRSKTISRRLANTSAEELSKFEVLGDGEGVSWPDLNEDLSAAFLVYPKRFQKGRSKRKAT